MTTITTMTSATERSDMSGHRVRQRIIQVVGVALRLTWQVGMIVVVTGCSLDSLLKSDELPPEVIDPAITRTPAGALDAYHGTLAQFRNGLGGLGNGSFLVVGGLLGDELQYPDDWFGEVTSGVDTRVIESTDGDVERAYSGIHRVRGQSTQAIGLLTRYAPGREALAGHLYALQGYAEIFLAELFCSGSPLSTIDFDGDFTPRPGSTTREVFEHSLALFNSARALAGDSARFVQLARVGEARARLALGEFAEAAAAAAQVENGYSYAVSFSATGTDALNFAYIQSGMLWNLTVADREGLNGLDYRTSGDPRTRVTARGTSVYGLTVYHPNKYATDGSSPIVIASGVEARLIEAEAALDAGSGTWLERLNALRTDGTFTTRPNDTDPEWTDTLWGAGIGEVAGLAPLGDPGSEEARVDLLFRERAFWLFLTGHRQGDLRRLIRQYGHAPEQVYPTGLSFGSRGLRYGSDVTLPIPPAEQISNPHFTGCASRGA